MEILLLVETSFLKSFSMIDKLVKGNVIHKNKAANLKSKLSKLSNISTSLAEEKKTRLKTNK